MIFKKNQKTIIVHCPKCKKKLSVDANLQKAFCQYCGQPFAFGETEKEQNASTQKSNLETIFAFIERQQDRMEERRQTRKRETAEARAKQGALIKKYWWLIALFVLTLITIITIGIILE